MRALFSVSARLSAAALLILAGCGKAEKPAESAASTAPPTVHVVATDYAFQAPDTLPAGITNFHLMNQGKELHHLVLLRLAPGMAPGDLLKMAPGAPPPAGAVMIGGPNFAPPGGTAEATVDLKVGSYAMFCVIPAADGKPHMLKGMLHALTVTAGASSAQAPAPDLTITLTDYAFATSKPLTAGHHVIRIENTAAQPHELIFVKFDAGKGMKDLMAWLEKPQGPPPAGAVNGASPMSPGEAISVSVDLTPGEYGFLCLVPDAKDGKPHAVHGMSQQFTVN